MKILLERPHQTSEEIDAGATIRFTLVNGDVFVSLTGGGYLRIERKGHEPLVIAPRSMSVIVVR